jgi:ferredoxin
MSQNEMHFDVAIIGAGFSATMVAVHLFKCIDCDLCRETAPANFRRSDDGGYSYVFKQPTTPEEEALCKEAMEGCPVEAIGNNGEG